MEYQLLALKVWRPLQTLIVVLCSIFIGVFTAQLTWLVVSPAEPKIAPVVQPAMASQSEGVNWLQLGREASSREFFGSVAVVTTEAAPEVTEAPDTNLNLTLQAVMAQGDGKGYAVIRQNSGAGKVFGLEDDLFGSATLVGVYADRVIIDRNGRRETLRYEKIQSSGILEPVDTAAAEQPASLQDAIVQANQAVANGGDLQTQVQGMVGYIVQRANEDPESFLNEVGLQPTDGGYQVTRRARQLQMVGLRPGDVVTSINDSPVGNIQNDQLLLNQVLQTGGELKIQISRGSRSFTIYQTLPTF